MIFFGVPPNDISASGGGGANMKKTELEQPTIYIISDPGVICKEGVNTI